jgi:topoisomerase IV subunit A
LSDSRALSELVVAEIEAAAAQFADARRTLIEAVAPVSASRTVPDEPVTITVSRHGWIRSRLGHGLDATQSVYKAGDAALAVLETRSVNPIVVLDTKGRAYTIRASDVPGGRGDGVPVTTLIDLQAGAKVAQAISASPEQKYLVAGSGGYGFIATVQDMVSRVKAGKAFMTLQENEEPLAPVAVSPGLDCVSALSAKGKLLVFSMEEMREVPKGRGVIVMGLDRGEKLIAVGLTTRSRVVVHGTNRIGKPTAAVIEGDELAKHLLHRARKGCLVARKMKLVGLGSET